MVTSTSQASHTWPEIPLVPSRETRAFAVAENVRAPFCPGTVVVTVTADPPGTIGALMSAGMR
jgi:hypothetical protein